jgi:tetratricopeptide (TPR) repeat protein
LSDAEKEKSTDALFYQGKVLRIRGDFENAIKKYTKYLKAQNGAVCALPEVYSELAGCYIELQDYGQAEDYLEQGLDLGVTMAYQNLLRNRVILLERMGKMRQAKELAAEYLQTYPYDKEMAKEAKFIATRIGNHSKKKQR